MDRISKEMFQQLISSEEGISLDFKKSDFLSDSFKVAKIFTAFANTIGGFVLIGICNDKSFEGLKYSDEYIRNIVSISRDKCDPSLAPEIRIHEDNNSFVYIVEIKRYSTIPYATKCKDGNVYYIRIGESVRQATPLELQKMFENKSTTQEKKPKLKPYFVNLEDKLVSTIMISPEFPIIEEKVTIIPQKQWEMKKKIESSVCSILQTWNHSDKTSIKLEPLTLAIVNEGDSPAENIRITVIFPEKFTMYEKSDLESSRLLINIPSHSKTFGGLYKHDVQKYICKGWINELGNDLKLKLNPIYPEVPDEDTAYNVNISISQNNYPLSEYLLKLEIKSLHPKIIKEIEKPDKI